MDNPTLDKIRRFKAATVLSGSDFSDLVLDQFAPYFTPLKLVVAELREVMVNKSSNLRDLGSFYSNRLDRTKAALAEARERGEPVDPILLASIPNSERDYHDVFQSIYEIIDNYLANAKEPVLPKRCVRPPKEAVVKVKKLSRQQIDINQPKGVRELGERNAEESAYRAEGVAVSKMREREENGGINPPSAVTFPPCSDAYQKLANLTKAGREFNEQIDATVANGKTIFERQHQQPLGSSSNDGRVHMAGAEMKTYGGSMDKPISNTGPPSSPLASGSVPTAPAEIDSDGGSTRRKIYNMSPPPSPDRTNFDERSRTPTPADSGFNDSKASIHSHPSLDYAICSDSDRFTMTPTPSFPHCNSVGEMGTPITPFDKFSNPRSPPRSECSTRLKRPTSTRDDSGGASDHRSSKRQRR